MALINITSVDSIDIDGHYDYFYDQMASLHRDSRKRSPFWYCAFYGPDGRRQFRSTKATDRKTALKICLGWEKAAASARRKELTAAQARKVIAEMVAVSSGETLSFHTVRSWLTDWLANKSGAVAERTLVRYRQVIRDFLMHMGPRAEAALASVSPREIIAFRTKLREEGRAADTCNSIIKGTLSGPFEVARKLGFIPINPVSAVQPLRERGEKAGREPFTFGELTRLIESAEGDWQGAILLGVTSGLRLSDLANLCWQSVDMEASRLRIETMKTGRVVVLPMHPDFASWLSTRSRGIGKAPVFPDLAGKFVGGRRGLSVQFREIVSKAGIVGRVVTREGKGRATNSKTFHALRHTFVSALANAGVAPDIRQKLAGHASAEVHGIYTHHELATLRGAIGKLPSLKAL
jgi:integrase